MLIAGVCEEDRPGSIQFFRYHQEKDMPAVEKVIEMQAHSKNVEEMRLTIDSKILISAGGDGSICFFNIDDKEMIKYRKGEVEYSEEILIEKQQQEELMQ
jgi:WD40 repeat protein